MTMQTVTGTFLSRFGVEPDLIDFLIDEINACIADINHNTKNKFKDHELFGESNLPRYVTEHLDTLADHFHKLLFACGAVGWATVTPLLHEDIHELTNKSIGNALGEVIACIIHDGEMTFLEIILVNLLGSDITSAECAETEASDFTPETDSQLPRSFIDAFPNGFE